MYIKNMRAEWQFEGNIHELKKKLWVREKNHFEEKREEDWKRLRNNGQRIWKKIQQKLVSVGVDRPSGEKKKKKDVRKAKEILQKESSFVSTLHWKCEPAKKDKKIKDIQTRKEEIKHSLCRLCDYLNRKPERLFKKR